MWDQEMHPRQDQAAPTQHCQKGSRKLKGPNGKSLPQQLCPVPHSLGLPEEIVLAHDGDEEANKAFNCHGNKPPCHDVPFEG